MSDLRNESVLLHDFKSRLCHYMHLLITGEKDRYVLKRYKKPVAIVMSVRGVALRRKADEAQARLNEYRATKKRHATERRLIAARLLSWPGTLYFGRRGQGPQAHS